MANRPAEHLGDLKSRFFSARPPDHIPEEWQSPYLMLGGALFSMGCANTDESMSIDLVMYDMEANNWNDLFDQVRSLKVNSSHNPWLQLWFSSFMLTNALFRISASAEKLCYLCGVKKEKGRLGLWQAVKTRSGKFYQALPLAHKYLAGMSRSWEDRADRLLKMRMYHQKTGRVKSPLMYAMIQADTDKHVPYRPLKVVDFEWQLALGSYVQALDMWEQALKAHDRGLVT